MNFKRTYTLKRNRSVLTILTLGLLLLLAAGCGQGASDEDGETHTPDAGSQEETRVVEHAMGETEVPTEPKRVVILTNEGTEALLAMGVTPVGAVRSWTGDPWYEHIEEQMEGVQDVGLESQVNIEAIAALQPDLIIGNKMRQENIYSQLSELAPTVFSDRLRGDWKINFELYADALNKVEKGNEVLNEFDQRIETLREQAADQLDTEISIVRFMAGQSRIYYNDTFSGIILDQIGFARPEAQDKDEFADEVTKERIPEMEGDVLFYFTYETGEGEATSTEEEWTSDPLWQNLEVVQEGNVHKVSDTIWNTAGGVLAANLLLDDLNAFFLE
ncbi:ABC transporter substrate-binding protein [Caldalkalibacillus salinus]|uniref:ABC transporter substrate-binding protein n=1 Tax=Caldalkalibacillus salinus TaxID=2803787 RepID=UPI0019218F8C|nr:iron-siderophore ABC transporter substrate-binding protein [Caldalkalibacillus salinus]